jgi:hypothetical protein
VKEHSRPFFLAGAKRTFAVLPSSLVIPTYFRVRLLPWNEGALHLNAFDQPNSKFF